MMKNRMRGSTASRLTLFWKSGPLSCSCRSTHNLRFWWTWRLRSVWPIAWPIPPTLAGWFTGDNEQWSDCCNRMEWCPGPESNRYARNERGILSPLCLPIPPPGHYFSTKRGGGSGEIRTHGRVAPSLVFKTSPFNHSGTLPSLRRSEAKHFSPCLTICVGRVAQRWTGRPEPHKLPAENNHIHDHFLRGHYRQHANPALLRRGFDLF